MRWRADSPRAAVIIAAAGMSLAGCATTPKGGAGAPRWRLDQATAAAWGALVEGRTDDAMAGFERRLRQAPDDVAAAFGRASVEYERAESPAALARYTALLELVAHGRGGAWGDVLAPVAAARLGKLLDEAGVGAPGKPQRGLPFRVSAEDRILAVPRQRLPWRARVELALLADGIARRRGQPQRLRELARQAGCARDVVYAGTLGTLPHLDLDRPSGAAVRHDGEALPRALPAAGCWLAVPSHRGRPGADVLRTAIDVPAGDYGIVLDYSGEARVRVDGSAAFPHGSGITWGPRRSGIAVRLSGGRHEIELRIATQGGSPRLSLMVMPLAPEGAPQPVAFVEPDGDGGGAKGAGAASRPPIVAPLASALDPDPGGGGGVGVGAGAASAGAEAQALLDFARAHAARDAGQVDQALEAGERLAARRRFGIGLALAARIASEDVTRPANLGRDAARALLRAAVAIDGRMARARYGIALAELADGRPRQAAEQGESAARAAPGWWPPQLTLAQAYRARGLDHDADRALDRALEAAAGAACPLLGAALARARDRDAVSEEARLAAELARCDGESDALVTWLRARGDLTAAATALHALAALDPGEQTRRSELASVLLAMGDGAGAARELAALARELPREASYHVSLADALAGAGDRDAARRTIERALALRPDDTAVRRAARAFGVALPLDGFRIDGADVIRAFGRSGRRYAAPSVLILDRTVVRVFPDGVQLILTHNIIKVQTKEGMERWGEVAIPGDGEVLALRTHKPDGTTREPEDIAGKDTVSAPELAIGDFLELETLEVRPPPDAFVPGFLGDRFFFQSFDAPLDRSEYILVTPPGMPLDVDARAGPPVALRRMATEAGVEGMMVTTYAATEARQLFAERSSTSVVEIVPSVRVSSGISFEGWSRFLREQVHGSLRGSPALRKTAASLAAAHPAPEALAAAIVAWAQERIEATSGLSDPASHTLARGQGDRVGLAMALARMGGLSARAVLARPLGTAAGDAAASVQEIQDFATPLIRFDLPTGVVMTDLSGRHAPLGYLPRSLAQALTLDFEAERLERAPGSAAIDRRSVAVRIDLDTAGRGAAEVVEELAGGPALEWAETLDRVGSDRPKLRQELEQRWLGLQFPGAVLEDLDVDLRDKGRSGARVRYTFVSPAMATLERGELKLAPTFFRSQPGRRYATEATRKAALVVGLDSDFDMRAEIRIPAGARVVEAGAGGRSGLSRETGIVFSEERAVKAGPPDAVVIIRAARMPFARVAPADYPRLAIELRRVDALEQSEIRIALPGRGS